MALSNASLLPSHFLLVIQRIQQAKPVNPASRRLACALLLLINSCDTSDRPHVCVQGVAQVALSLRFARKSITPFDPRDHGDESQDAQMCKLQEVWATSKGPPCEILHALFCGKRKAER